MKITKKDNHEMCVCFVFFENVSGLCDVTSCELARKASG